MWELTRRSGTLDLNSPYAYLLAAHHFASTSVVAIDDTGQLAGFVMAYPPPGRPEVFVWQVAVDAAQRGRGLARQMIHEVVDRARRAHGSTRLSATVTPSNDASRNLFRAVARELDTGYDERPCFGADLFPGEGHEPEHEVRVGPFDTSRTT